jgi:hypothetical protein
LGRAFGPAPCELFHKVLFSGEKEKLRRFARQHRRNPKVSLKFFLNPGSERYNALF